MRVPNPDKRRVLDLLRKESSLRLGQIAQKLAIDKSRASNALRSLMKQGAVRSEVRYAAIETSKNSA